MNRKQFENQKFRHVIVQDWMRIFNKIVSRSVWQQYMSGDEIATLNAIPKSGCSFNAIAYYVDDNAITQLIDREEDYRVIQEVAAIDMETGDSLSKYKLFVANPKNKHGIEITANDIFPIKKYLEVCREGAYSWSEEFGKQFDETTFLSNGKTSIASHLE